MSATAVKTPPETSRSNSGEKSRRKRERRKLTEFIARENQFDAAYRSHLRWCERRSVSKRKRKTRRAHLRMDRTWARGKSSDTRHWRRAEWAAQGHDRPMWQPKVKPPVVPHAVFERMRRVAKAQMQVINRMVLRMKGASL